ncbi:competence protein ComER [Evansella caseinilytica]|uniref:Competence protein ComER n=1 Tax=Evansella caseinilytica TaxID=1503961 RepID=A0A1H3KGM2_9BACI|nr:late competence protein ComER [Evansella caseinilytica]SDY50768.1 competence protein ComER [Evansella caseinilytica]
MKRIGFIGTGSMGKILIQSFLEARAIAPEKLWITNRTIEKAYALAASYEELNVVHDARTLIKQCDWIFICTKPLQIIPILQDNADVLTAEQTIISITSPILVHELASVTTANAVRFIPSIVNRALDGPSLVTFGTAVNEADKTDLLRLFSAVSKPEIIDDSITRIASDIGCCGPAFLSFLIEKMIDAAVEKTKISEEEATAIMESMLIGYGELLKQKHFTLQTLQERVTVPGGVTGAGLEVLKAEITDQFHHLFEKTHEKYDEDRHLVQKQMQELKKSEE